MKTTISWPVRRQSAGGLFLFLLALVAGIPSCLGAPKFTHATLGRMEIYSGDSPEATKRFLIELLEVRRQIQELVAPVPLPDPRMQIVIFNRLADYEDFLPEKSVLQRGETTVSGFTSTDYGVVGAVVRESSFGYDFGRETLVYYYAAFLLQSAVPDTPLWVRAGIPEFFAPTSCRGNRVLIGEDFMKHRDSVRSASKMMPLAELMDDRAMAPYFGVAKHDNDFYHESWVLWQQWLADPDPRRRMQVNRLLAAIRGGRKGNLATVVESFGEPAEAIEAAHRARKTARGFSPRESNLDAASLVRGLVFEPATELDRRFAQAMLAGGRGKAPGSLGAELYRLGEANPASPRPVEALAVLAMGEKDYATAAVRWERARELGTDNLYAYLLPVREALASRRFYFSLQSQLAEVLCAKWRESLNRCVEIDPGCVDARFYRILIEAFAEKPDRAAVDAVAQSQVLAVQPMGYLYLAIARWRLGQTVEAHQILASLLEYPKLGVDTRARITALDAFMLGKEAKPDSAPGS